MIIYGIVALIFMAVILAVVDQGTHIRPSGRAVILRWATVFWKRPEHQSIEHARQSMEQWSKKDRPKDITRIDVNIDGVRAAWLCPINVSQDRAILFLHGGGYTVGSIETHQFYAASIAKEANICVLIIDYRLAPESPFPAALEDAITAYKWLLKQNIPASNIAIFGDSAGGGLAAATFLALRNEQQTLPAALALVSPWLDLANTGISHKTNAANDVVLKTESLNISAHDYAGTHSITDSLISPLYDDLSGVPPTLILVSKEEILLSDSERFADQIRKSQGDITLEIWHGMMHDWPVIGNILPETHRAIKHVAQYIQVHLNTDRK